MRLSAFPLALALCLTIPAFGQSLSLRVSAHDGAALADVSFHWEREEELIGSLKQGLESRVSLTLRLYERRPAILPFLSDVLIEEKSLSQSAFYDFLEQKFVIESETGKRTMFERPEDLLREFFSWTSVGFLRRFRSAAPFVTARVQFDPVRLVPPLTIVSLVGAAGTLMTPWVREEIAQP